MARKRKPNPGRPRRPRPQSKQQYRCTAKDWETVLAHHLTPFREALARIETRARRAELGIPEVTTASKRDEAFAKMRDSR
jgi:hypothetical protein